MTKGLDSVKLLKINFRDVGDGAVDKGVLWCGD